MSIKDFVPIEKLGEGSFATVYKVRRMTDQKIYAIKKIKMTKLDKKAKDNSLNEIRLLASLSSPYIVTFHESFFQQNLDVLCIVMEYADGGDLSKIIQKYKKQKKIITEIEIWKVLLHLLHGLDLLHNKNVLHRDLKCENIFIVNGTYKIGDMNVSKVNKCGFVQTQTGTPYYVSPEVWQDKPYDQKCDIWSVGCILYEMAALRPPFVGQSMEDLYKSVLKGQYAPIPKFYSNQLSFIISQCLTLNPFQRPNAQTLLSNFTIKMYQNICIQYKVPESQKQKELLKTINMPTNKKQLKNSLPKSNYHEFSVIKEQSKELQFKVQLKDLVYHSQQKNIQKVLSISNTNVKEKREEKSIYSQILDQKNKQNQNKRAVSPIKQKQMLKNQMENIFKSIKIEKEKIINQNFVQEIKKNYDEVQSQKRLIEKIKINNQKSKNQAKRSDKKFRRYFKQLSPNKPFSKNSSNSNILKTKRSKSLPRTESQNKVKLQHLFHQKIKQKQVRSKSIHLLQKKSNLEGEQSNIIRQKIQKNVDSYEFLQKQVLQKRLFKNNENCNYQKIIEKAKNILLHNNQKYHKKKIFS